jgi:hypothetical protein
MSETFMVIPRGSTLRIAEMDKKVKKVTLTTSITQEAKDRLFSWADDLAGQGERLPIGRVLTALILEFEESGNWPDLEERLQKEFVEDNWQRRSKRRDYDRKRKKKKRNLK